KRKFGVHTAGVCPHRHIDKIAQFREFHNFLFLGANFLLGKTEKHSGKDDVLAACHLPLEPDSDGEQGNTVSMQVYGSAVRGKDSGQCVQCCGLAASVLADDSQDLSLAHIKGNSFYRHKTFGSAMPEMQQALFNRSLFQILIADHEISYVYRMFFFHNSSLFRTGRIRYQITLT